MFARRMLLAVAGLAAVAWFTATPRAEGAGQPSPDEVKKAEQLVQEYVAKFKGSSKGQLIHVTDPALQRSLPKDIFITVRYKLHPVAQMVPEGLAHSNLFIVHQGMLHHIKDGNALIRYFQEYLTTVKVAPEATAAARSFLVLAQEFIQDGFYKFEIPEQELVVTGKGDETERLKVNGRAVVMAGGNGELKLLLGFTDGKLTKADFDSKVRPGPRPICQATKLLDPDPIVRRMAERDLLYLGALAKEYLFEQRERASPELREAIDRLWKRIVEEGQ
jgi:hypothetical protein